MIGTIRLTLALLAVVAATPPMMAWQVAALRTGLLDARRVPRLWHRMVAGLLGLRIHVHGELAEERPLLIAANHVSWTDIVVLSALADVHFVAKSEMAGWPVFGTFARLQRSIFVERQRRRKAGAQAGEIAGRLADGDPVVLFAEGTTSDGNLMLPFNSTLFAAAQMALDARPGETIAIQPVSIAYTRLQGLPMGRQHRVHAAWIGDSVLLPHIGERLSEGAIDLEVRFGEPVRFAAGASRKQVARQVEARVRAMMMESIRQPR